MAFVFLGLQLRRRSGPVDRSVDALCQVSPDSVLPEGRVARGWCKPAPDLVSSHARFWGTASGGTYRGVCMVELDWHLRGTGYFSLPLQQKAGDKKFGNDLGWAHYKK